MIAAAVFVIWVAVSVVGGMPEAAVFPTKEVCTEAVERVTAAMVADGMGDGDMISECVEVTVKEPGIKA